jgi:hypothetical protein
MPLDPCVVQFLMRAAVAESAHRLPIPKVPERGHARNAFDLGLDSFSAEVAAILMRLGIVWEAPDRGDPS